MKRISEVLSWKFWIWLPVVGILLPLIFNLLPGDWVNVKLMVALFIVNMLFSIYVGNFFALPWCVLNLVNCLAGNFFDFSLVGHQFKNVWLLPSLSLLGD